MYWHVVEFYAHHRLFIYFWHAARHAHYVLPTGINGAWYANHPLLP